MALRIALCSSFDGISDLKKWRREGIIDDQTWEIVADKLKLKSCKGRITGSNTKRGISQA
jgi:uncharacterized membrane protein